MAILAPNGQDPNDPNNQPNQGGGGTVTNSAGGGGGNAPGVTPGGGSPSAFNSNANTAARPAGNPSGQPNVNDYLSANQSAGQRLAGGITSNIQNQANQVNSTVNTNQNQLSGQYNSLNNTLGQGQSAANTAFQDPQALLSAYQNAQASTAGGSAYQGPQANNTDLQNYNAFQGDVAGTNQYNQQQQQLQNYNTAGQQASNTAQTQLGNLSQSTSQGANEMGRNQLLQQTVGNPNYNQGQQTLDSLFLQGQGNQLQQNLGNIQNTTASNINNATSDYQNKLNALQNLSGQNTQYAKNLFTNGPGTGANTPQGTGLNQIAANVGNEYTAAQASTAGNPALQAALTSGKLTAQQASTLGITPGTSTWGLTNLQNYFSPTTLNAANSGGNAQVATPEEFARYNALNQLAGGPSGALQSGTNNLFGGATSAGGYSPYSFNNAKLNTDIANQQQTISTTDALNALANINPSSNQGNETGWMNQLKMAEAAGADPNALNKILNQDITTFNRSADVQGTAGSATSNPYENQLWSPWTNYYNNQFLPAQNDIIGAPSAPQQIGAYTGGVKGSV